MLLEMRKVTRGVFATLLLGAIAVAMVLFLIPRIGGSGFAPTVARVGNTDITPAELSRHLDAALEQARLNGQNVTRAEAIEHNVHMQLLETMIRRTAVYEYARSRGVDVSDAQIATAIRDLQGLRNPVTGRFDERMLDEALGRRHMSRAEFLNDIRVEMTDGMLLESLVAGVRPPPSFGALLVAYRNESRVISVAEAPPSAVGVVPAPTEAQLTTFYQSTRDAWRVPEYRAVTLVYARDSDFTARVNVPDAPVEAAFQQQRGTLEQPEKRSSVRITATTEQQANAIAQRLGRGEDANAVAGSMGLRAIHGADEARNAVSDANVATAVFAMTPNSAPRVVRGTLSPFVVVKVLSITAAIHPTPAAENALRAQIRQQMASDAARDLKDAATNAFDESRGGGASTAEAARRAGLQVVTIPAVDAQGRDPAGQPIAVFAGDNNELLRTLNSTAEGEASDFLPIEDNTDVVVSVDRITPAATRPFAQVRDQVEQRWRAQELTRRAQEFANTVLREVQGGRPFAAVAAAHHMQFRLRSQGFTREQAQRLPPRLAAQVFGGAQGDVVSETGVDPQGRGAGVLVAVIEQIRRPDLSQATQDIQQARLVVSRGIANDYAEAVQAQITADAHPQRHPDVIQRTFRNTDNANAPVQDTGQ